MYSNTLKRLVKKANKNFLTYVSIRNRDEISESVKTSLLRDVYDKLKKINRIVGGENNENISKQ